MWKQAQAAEREWWGDCANSYQEETKQRDMIAPRLGLTEASNHPSGHWPVYDMGGARVADIGGGPVSLLLKCVNLGEGSVVIDPCRYPRWVGSRYRAAGIGLLRRKAEGLSGRFDQVWMYNVLQHVDDPEAVCAAALALAPVIRIVEYVDFEADERHPHNLQAGDLDRWLGGDGPFRGQGIVEYLPQYFGHVYYGVFRNS